MSATELTSFVLSLDSEERAHLMGLLLDVVEGADPTDHGLDSYTEAAMRQEELTSGKVKALSEEEFWAGLRER